MSTTTLSNTMPSLVASTPEQNVINNGNDESVATSSAPVTEVKKIVLLKRPTTIPSNDLANGAGASTFPAPQTPNRSGASSPIMDDELTAEESASFGEIDSQTGLDGFLLAALKNPKDRLFLLKLDQDMERFIKDKNRTRLEFPPMNSYQRLIVHRVAQYFKLSHVVDNSGKAVVLYKSQETSIPILRFSDLLEQEEEKPEKSVKIMRRQQSNPNSAFRSSGDNSDSNSENERRQYKTIEEREAAYLKARARIFKDWEKNSDDEQEETDGTKSANASTNKSSNATSNEQPQNNDSLPSNNKSKGNNQQVKSTNSNGSNSSSSNNNNGKSGKQGQQSNKGAGTNKSTNNNNNINSNNNKSGTSKNRQQQQSTKTQTLNYNPSDRSAYMMSKQGRVINTFPGPPMMPPMMHPSNFAGPPYFNHPFDFVPMQQSNMLPPDMQVGHQMPNPYMTMPPAEWNASMGTPFVRPGARNHWTPELLNTSAEMGGNPSIFNQQQTNPVFFPPRPTTQNDNNFAASQGPNSMKLLNQFPQNQPPPPSSAFSDSNQYVTPPVDNPNRPLRDGTTTPTSPLSPPVLDGSSQSAPLWVKNGQWGHVNGVEGVNETKMIERHDQKRLNNRNSTPFIPPQQRDPFQFNPVWNNTSDSPAMGIFNPPQSTQDYPLQNGPMPQMSHMPSHIFPGMMPPPMQNGPRRLNPNQMYPGAMPSEYMNVPRLGVLPPQLQVMGFQPQVLPQSAVYDVEKRPPKSTELFDPNTPQNSSLPNAPLTSPPPMPSPHTNSRPTTPVTSSVMPNPPPNLHGPVPATTTVPWIGGTGGSKGTILPNPTHSNTRRKHMTDPTNNISNNNAIVDGTMMRALSLSSTNNNHQSNKANQSHHQHRSSSSSSSQHFRSSTSSQQNRSSSTSPPGQNKNKKESGLLFDYRMQAPYEGVKPSEANEPPQPNHILELYDFAEADNMTDISLANATIKRITQTKPPTILAIFKNKREANAALQESNRLMHTRGVRFKLKTWEPLVKNNANAMPLVTNTSGGNASPSSSSPSSSSSSSFTTSSLKTNNNQEVGEKQQPSFTATVNRNPPNNVKKQ